MYLLRQVVQGGVAVQMLHNVLFHLVHHVLGLLFHTLVFQGKNALRHMPQVAEGILPVGMH